MPNCGTTNLFGNSFTINCVKLCKNILYALEYNEQHVSIFFFFRFLACSMFRYKIWLRYFLSYTRKVFCCFTGKHLMVLVCIVAYKHHHLKFVGLIFKKNKTKKLHKSFLRKKKMCKEKSLFIYRKGNRFSLECSYNSNILIPSVQWISWIM